MVQTEKQTDICGCVHVCLYMNVHRCLSALSIIRQNTLFCGRHATLNIISMIEKRNTFNLKWSELLCDTNGLFCTEMSPSNSNLMALFLKHQL